MLPLKRSYRRMESLPSREAVRILLISKTSFDKSVTGNVILQNDVFATDELEGAPIPRTRSTSFNGRMIEVTDTPGLMDSYSKMKCKESIQDYLKKCDQGYDAVVIVLRYPVRMTPEEEESIQMIKEIVGENDLMRFGILLFTNGSSFKRHPSPTFEEYLHREINTYQGFQSAGRITLGKLITEVHQRCLLFDNDTEDQIDITSQIQSLLDTVDRMKMQNYNKKFDKSWPCKGHTKKIMFALAACGVVVMVIVIVSVTAK